MKKYVNGKIMEMTESDVAKRESRIGSRPNAHKNTSDYEKRVKELEDTVAVLLAQIKEVPEAAEEELTTDKEA